MAPPAWVLHVDLDQFIAAVEVLRRPELRGLPVVVGGTGDPARREVVATASYEARAFGVRSGLPLRLALKRCPDAVLLASDPAAYTAASEQVMAALRDFGAVEVLGWDEAFLGVATEDPEALAAEVMAAVLDRTRLSCSVGIGDTRPRAKLATDFGKPAGVFRLTRDNWDEVMAHRPTDALWGIGARTARKLAELDLRTVADLAGADPGVLAARFGPAMGPWYRTLALGTGSAEVSTMPWVRRSLSRESTFQVDLTDRADLRAAVATLARRVAEDVADEGRPVVRVAVKVRFAPFLTRTRSRALPAPTTDAAALAAAALAVLERFELGRPVRLLGVRAEFEPPVGGY